MNSLNSLSTAKKSARYEGQSTIGPGPECEARAPQIREQLDELIRQTDTLTTLISGVHDKLAPVMCLHPADGSNQSAPESVIAPLASDIRTLRRRVEEANAALRYLIDHIEL